VWQQYYIYDEAGHSASSSIGIHYPEIFVANYDGVHASERVAQTVDVLENDVIVDKEQTTVMLKFNGNNGTEYGTFYETNDGNWTVTDDKKIMFEPAEGIDSTYLNIEYRISDTVDGYLSETWLSIEYTSE
jgi:hypothetical protein